MLLGSAVLLEHPSQLRGGIVGDVDLLGEAVSLGDDDEGKCGPVSVVDNFVNLPGS